jgi:hypothetical protein
MPVGAQDPPHGRLAQPVAQTDELTVYPAISCTVPKLVTQAVTWCFLGACDRNMIPCRAAQTTVFELCHGVRLAGLLARSAAAQDIES